MSLRPCTCSEDIRSLALRLGAVVCRFAKAEPVSADAISAYDRWVDASHNGSMDYCGKYSDVRNDPRLLLNGAKTLIVCAYNYNNSGVKPNLGIAKYAWGDDYHYVIKSRLNKLADYIAEHYGGECRAVVDTAPIRERYWAQRSGVGFIGKNNQLIVPGVGSYVFIGILLWTGEVEPDAPLYDQCDGCGACVRVCPGGALDGSGICDARRCVSYLTIEHRGELPENIDLEGMIYGCDVCQEVCPHNRYAPTTLIPEFKPNPEIMMLTGEDLMSMTSSHYKRMVAHSAMRRVTLQQLQRNLRHLATRHS